MESEFPLDMWRESFLLSFQNDPKEKGGCSEVWGTACVGSQLIDVKFPSEMEKNPNKCKEIEIELFVCLVIMTDAWGLFDKEIKNRLRFMV